MRDRFRPKILDEGELDPVIVGAHRGDGDGNGGVRVIGDESALEHLQKERLVTLHYNGPCVFASCDGASRIRCVTAITKPHPDSTHDVLYRPHTHSPIT